MIKITRALAKKMWERGEEVMIIPDRVRTDSVLAAWSKKPESELKADDFSKLCNAIHYYNCSPQTGMKLAFYAKEV